MMNRSILLLSLLFLWLCLPHVACCEEADTLRLIHRVGVDFRPSRIVQDDPFFEGENQLGRPMRFGYSCHLKYSFQFADNSRMGTLYPHTYQGIGLSYNDLGNRKAHQWRFMLFKVRVSLSFPLPCRWTMSGILEPLSDGKSLTASAIPTIPWWVRR